jgi:HEPN domain-containing protein
MDDPSREWAERAQYDLDTANAMFRAGRHFYVLFCCQQAVERALKAVMVQKTGELPPRLRHLLRLAEAAEVELGQGEIHFLATLSGFYIQSRSPEGIRVPGETVTQEWAREILRKTEETVKWVLSMLQ